MRARARPWNDAILDPMVRLERGGSDFLSAVSSTLFAFGAKSVYSPALYPGSTRVWTRTGFEDFAALDVMERPLVAERPPDPKDVRMVQAPDWDEILDIDQESFDGFWGMSRLGLTEAHETNRSTALFVVGQDHRLAGYAIVGAQWGTVYLHRIAVRPDESGHGLGGALLARSINWGVGTGSRTMVLNVRPENSRAKSLYRRLGFTDTGTALRVYRHPRT